MISRLSGSTREALKAAAILGLVIVVVFGDVSFLGYTLSPSVYTFGVLVPPYGYQGRWLRYPTNMDPQASGGEMVPTWELISKTLFSGRLPLWNPYQGTGIPLSADITSSTYFPVDVLYVLPNQYWDFVWLLKIWLAGIICYLFLRRLGLGHISAMGGGFAYCLSGAFIFYLFLPWTNAAILTPALLLVVKRCFDESPARRTIALGSTVFTISLLAAQPEALVIQFLYVNLFVVFEAIKSKGEKIRGIATWVGVVFFGLGLASFFLFPVSEYLSEATLSHTGYFGLTSLSTGGNPVIWWVTLFVPYFYGFLQAYPYERLGQVFFWDISPGYVGTTVFFLSLLPLFSGRLFAKDYGKRYYGFFLLSGILVLMKIFGIPPINWIGFLPVLQHVIFSRYSGSVLAMSFSGACAFGLESVLRPVKHSSTKALLIVFGALGLGIWAIVPFPVSPAKPFFVASLAYLALSLFYLVMACRMASTGGSRAAKVLAVLIVLELASYVPRSLSPEYEAIRVVILAGAALILVGSQTKWPRFMMDWVPPRHASLPSFLSRNHVYATIVIVALVLQFVVAGLSPIGLPNRYDPYTEAPYVRFLQANTGYQRVYSLDGLLFPPVAGVFTIQHLGVFTAEIPTSFGNFLLVNLDRGAVRTILWGGPGARGPATELNRNIRFYNFLGVKYVITNSSDPNQWGEIVGGNVAIPIDRGGNYSLGQSFYSPVDDFRSVAIQLGAYGRVNRGSIILTLDSVPYDVGYHRTVALPAGEVHDSWPPTTFNFTSVNNASGKQFYFGLRFPEANSTNAIAVWSYDASSSYAGAISALFKGQMYKDGEPMNGTMAFAIPTAHFQLVYGDGIAKIYENPTAFPRTFIVHRFQVAASTEEAQRIIEKQDFNLREQVALDTSLADTEGKTLEQTPRMDGSKAEITLYEPDRVVIKAYAEHGSILVLTDTYYPGWEARVDGVPTAIYRADGLVRAVYLAQGEHMIEFIYYPESFRIGLTTTVISAAILLSLLATGRFKMRRRSGIGPQDRVIEGS